MRQSIEQGHRNLDNLNETGTRELQDVYSILRIVSELRTQMKKP
jgi:hypothetical protein